MPKIAHSRVLALDLATRTGWACSNGKSGVYDLPKGENGLRWTAFEEWLAELCREHKAAVIVAEASLHQPGHAGRMANALHTMIEIVSWRQSCRYHRCAASTIKKHATGNGRATKEEMYQAALLRNDLREYASYDEVDALWILDYAITQGV